MTRRKKKRIIYGYDLNTGEPILDYKDHLVHQGNGFYTKASEITREDIERNHRFFATLESELLFKKMGRDEH
jgi:hypothetical protein